MFEKNQKLFILTKSIWKQGIKIPDRYMQVYHNGSLSFDTFLISRTAFLQDAALYKATSHKNIAFLFDGIVAFAPFAWMYFNTLLLL